MADPKAPKKPRPRLGPLRAGEIPGIRPDRRPYATIALIIVPIVLTLVGRAGWDDIATLIMGGPLDGDWWRPITTQFIYGSTGYEVAALAAVAIFGILLERRHGMWAPLLVFLVGGDARHAARRRASTRAASPWAATRPRWRCWPPGRCATCSAAAAASRTTRTCSACSPSPSLLVLLPLATEDAHALAGLGGGLAGSSMGLGLARMRER